MAYEKMIVKVQRGGHRLPILTVNKAGRVTLNGAALAALGSAKDRKFDLYVDRANAMLGFDPHDKGMYILPRGPCCAVIQLALESFRKLRPGEHFLLGRVDNKPPIRFELEVRGVGSKG